MPMPTLAVCSILVLISVLVIIMFTSENMSLYKQALGRDWKKSTQKYKQIESGENSENPNIDDVFNKSCTEYNK